MALPRWRRNTKRFWQARGPDGHLNKNCYPELVDVLAMVGEASDMLFIGIHRASGIMFRCQTLTSFFGGTWTQPTGSGTFSCEVLVLDCAACVAWFLPWSFDIQDRIEVVSSRVWGLNRQASTSHVAKQYSPVVFLGLESPLAHWDDPPQAQINYYHCMNLRQPFKRLYGQGPLWVLPCNELITPQIRLLQYINILQGFLVTSCIVGPTILFFV